MSVTIREVTGADGGPMPALNVDNTRNRLAIAAWRGLPLSAARGLERPLACGRS